MKTALWKRPIQGLRSYLKALNMDTRDGWIRPSPRQMATFDDVSAGISQGGVAPTMVRWAWNTVATAWIAKYKYIRYFRSGVWWSGDHDCGAQVTDLCGYGNITGDPRVIVCYGNGDYIDSADGYIDFTASTQVKLLYATVAGPDLYAVTDGGTYCTTKVSKCQPGSNPLLSASWPAGEPVGSPMYNVTALRSIGGAPVAAKPEGLFAWENTEGIYRNWLPWLENSAHVDNGKGMFTAKDGVCYPTVDGGLFRFNGFSVQDISPKNFTTRHRDNPHLRARITAGCDIGDWLLVATEPFSGCWTKGFGLKVLTLDGSTYADITTNCTDGDWSTGGSVAGLGNGDYVIVGADVPFEAVHFEMGSLNAAAGPYLQRPQYCSNATGPVWTDIGPGSSNAPDGTSYNGVMFAKNGYIRWRNFFTAHSSMKKVALSTYGTKYWVRFPIYAASGTITAGTTLAEVTIAPSRPPVSSAAALAYTGPDAAGAFAHILAGRPNDREGWEWHDLFCVPVHAPIDAMCYTWMDTKQAEENQGNRLLMITQFDGIQAMMGMTDTPTAPVNENYVDGMAMGTPVIFFSPTDFGTVDEDYATCHKQVNEFHVHGKYVDGSDTVTMLARWDHNKYDTVGTASNAPSRVPYDTGGTGLVLEAALAYEDVDIELGGPRIGHVDVDYDVLDPDGHPFDSIVQGDAVTPEVE